ncbi:hypothetical protein FKW77_005696 [Venturia effusa]|uniref:Uncharacterized protein n=1 Tax=Venturia effusa TaxID=50376 RepID=A0A517LK93_9PEZI|nr:hypothetical protein FKW77_005696 [Venturia effusa]
MAFLSYAGSRTLHVGFLIWSAYVGSVQSKAASRTPAVFDKPIQLTGNMTSNDIDFVDGLKINVYSPVDREVTVTKNDSPLNGTFVTGTTGTGYRTLQAYSYVFKTNPPGNDMIATINLPYDPTTLEEMSIERGDTFIGKLAEDKKAWIVSTAQQTVQRAESKTSMSQMTSLDGEYVILGRKGTDNGNIFMRYGTGAQLSANFTGGLGRQDVEFIDGLRFAVQSETPLRMNARLKYPLDESDIPEGMVSLNAYAWVVNTTGRVELTPAPIPPAPANGTSISLNVTSTPANGNTITLSAPPNAPPAPVDPAKPFTFANSRRRQLSPAAAPQPIPADPQASGSPDLPATNPGAKPKPAAPAPPAIANSPAPPFPDSPSAPVPPASSPSGGGIVIAARIEFPLNMNNVRQVMRNNSGSGTANPITGAALSDSEILSTLKFTIGRRPIDAKQNSPFTVVPMAAGGGLTPDTGGTDAGTGDAQSLQIINGRLVFEGVTQLDGEYVILIPLDSATTAKMVAAKAGLIKQTSGAQVNARVGAAIGTLAMGLWFLFML